jgi:hypothetical protein
MGSIRFELSVSEASARGTIEANIDPAPTEQTVFKKVRREFSFSVFGMEFPFDQLCRNL